MKKQKATSHFLLILMFSIILSNNLMQPIAFGDLILNPPPDVDKAFLAGNATCWMATASNMLAGAGYGSGLSVQDRADDIYSDMVGHYGTWIGGWPDTALTWWINSSHNTNKSSPYKHIVPQDNKNKTPWLKPDGPRIIGNHLRDWEYIGLVFYNVNWYHAITVWGDDAGLGQLMSNPTEIWIADSDTDAGGDVQEYTYDAYSTINGWRFDYDAPHVTIEGITVLQPVDTATDHTNTQVVVGSLSIHQDDNEKNATDLHYDVGTDVDILSYRTEIDWPRPNNPAPPVIVEDSQLRNLTVDWDMSEDTVPYCNWVTITTSFVVPTWNRIKYDDVHWTYQTGSGGMFPGFIWGIETPMYIDPNEVIENITGGYVIGSFDVFTDPLGTNRIGQFRGIHEYDYFQDPEDHKFELIPLQEGQFYVGNIRFGHSYGYLDVDSLWAFDAWMSEYPSIQSFVPGEPITIHIDWEGLLPYPQAPGPTLVIARGPYPADGAMLPDVSVSLGWSPAPSAVLHDVYFGTDYDAVANTDVADVTGVYRGRVLASSYTPIDTPLERGQTYYWRIDELEADGTIQAGDVWSFTVESEEPGPFFSVSTLSEWNSLLNRPDGEYPRIDPVDANTFSAMVESSDAWPSEYKEAFFTIPELDAREHSDSSGRLEPALYMRWGPEVDRVRPGVYNAAAWDYIYQRASDLSDVELEFSVHAPRESMRVSVNLIDADGDWIEFIWHVGLPGEIPACQWAIVKIVPSTGYSNYRLRCPAFEGGLGDGHVDLTRITRIRFDENGIWSDEFPFPLDEGWMWNAWNHIVVKPSPYLDISTLDEWNLLLNRPVGQYPRIDPVDANTFAGMVESSDAWPSEYKEAFFATPELDAREHEDSSGHVEPALYMLWGPEGDRVQPEVYNAAAWDYIYDKPSDLSNVELEFSIHAPRESMRVSVNLIDADDDWLEFIWHVGLSGEIPACQWTIVKIVPSTGYSNYRLLYRAFEGGRGDKHVDLTRITKIRFDENGIWSDEFPFPLDEGWMWNAWNHIAVKPGPVDLDTDGLVAYYAFENDTTDSSGNGLDGTVIGDPEFVGGVEGMALDFNGDDYVDCDGNVEFSFTAAMTVSTWVNIRSRPVAWMAMIAKGENAWRLGVNNETTGIHYAFSGGDRGWQQANTATELNLDEWYHVTATYDTNVGALVYIDGVVDASNPDLDGIDTNEFSLLLGDNPEATGRFFDGMLDEVKIYNRALSEGEISLLAGLR